MGGSHLRKGTGFYWLASLVAQSVKNLPAVQETWVRSLGREGALEKEMATHSSILTWEISWTEEPGGLQSIASQRIGHDWVTNTYLLTSCVAQRTHYFVIVYKGKESEKNTALYR